MSDPSSYDLERMSVLLVEDSRYILHAMTDVLRHMGVGKVLQAGDGVAAIEVLKDSRVHTGHGSRIDLVISDLVMSPIDGLVLLKWIREGRDSPDRFLPVIMMSGAADDEYVGQARDQGVNEFLAKPFSAASVAERILEVIDKPRQFVATKSYFGPDRHRKRDADAAEERRSLSERDANVVYSADRVVRPKDPNDVYLFRLNNRLKEKVGGLGSTGEGALPAHLLREADAHLERKAIEFLDWAQGYLASLSKLCMAAQRAPENQRRQHIEKINLLAHELRGQGGIFGYALITTTGKYLYELTRLGCPTDDTTIDVIKAHIDTMRVVFRDKVTGDGGALGRELIQALEEAIRKYAAHQGRHVLMPKLPKAPAAGNDAPSPPARPGVQPLIGTQKKPA